MVQYIGEPLIKQTGPEGTVWSNRIATAFPVAGVIVTTPGIHATQRQAYTDQLDQNRRAQAMPLLSHAQRMDIWLEAVDLLVEGENILIRPDPDRMDLAFKADELLQDLAPRQRIRFLFARNAKVRDAINRRGEAWRIQPLPRSKEEMRRLIVNSPVAVRGRPIYYYCAVHGTRILTYAQFNGLGVMSDDDLRLHLGEIAALGRGRNVRGWPEMALFMTGETLAADQLLPREVASLDVTAMRQCYVDACRRFAEAVPLDYQHDDVDNPIWRNPMYRALIAQGDDTLVDEDLLGLSDEYSMQIHWLPGARMEEEELIVDMTPTDDPAVDAIVHELICNLTREYNGIEFINMGKVVRSMSRRGSSSGRREVFVAHFRPRGASSDELHVIRFHKWGVRERLDEGKHMLRAMLESEEYTDYILDRRLACRQLGMNLAGRVWTRKIQERYDGSNRAHHGATIWSPYVQRDYIPGIASDKAPRARLRDPDYAAQLATALGRAAAANIIVGRADLHEQVVFDDGDEILVEDAQGGIADVVVADPTGSFTRFRQPLVEDAAAYAAPVND
ncbi:MAG: hypothetical protein IT440_01575, partial [Phycisphaeraceae bacterium]|nr:hypothetical protein [Phycisphaeraceae bacterium]